MSPRSLDVALVDLGVGNLHSLEKALELALSGEGSSPPALESALSLRVVTEPARALDADLVVLPGVGAFGAAAARLAPARDELREALLAGKPCIGICLGMQLLFDASEEGEGLGLGVIPGRVTRLAAARVPHMGWNRLTPKRWSSNEMGPDAGADTDPSGAPLGGPLPEAVYYAHSFACRAAEPSHVLVETEHEGDRFPAIVRAARTVGFQFHPEKSSREGVALLGRVARALVASARRGGRP